MRHFLILFCLIIMVLFLAIDINTLAYNDKVIIYIDPGHGGSDPGAYIDNYKESDINLSISYKLKDIFEENNYEVRLTRLGDYDLSTDPKNKKRTDIRKRVELIGKSDCQFYLSIHLNSFSQSNYRGAQVFYNPNNDDSMQLANNIQNSMIYYLKNTTRKAKAIKDVYLVDNLNKTGCLIECGFMSNKEELNLLLNDAYQSLLAKAIYYGAIEFEDL